MASGKRATSRRITTSATPGNATERDSRERLQNVVALTADFYWEQDAQHRFTVCWSAGTFDLDLDLVRGKTLWELCREPPVGDTWEAHQDELAAHQPFRGLVVSVPDAGQGARFLSLSGTPTFTGRKFSGYCGIARDVTYERRTARLVQLEQTVAQLLADAHDIHSGICAVLQAVAESEQWTAGEFWSVEEHSDRLQHQAGWGSGTQGHCSVFSGGERLPGWAQRGPVWIEDLEHDPRAATITRMAGQDCSTGLFVPVHTESRTIGLMAFYAPRLTEPDPQYLRLLRTISIEVSSFVQRSTALEQLRESEERLSSTLALAAIGMAHVGTGGRFLYANPQLCEMLGYTEAEMLEKTVRDISHPDDMAATDEQRQRLRSGAVRSFKLEKRYLRKDGSTVWAGLTVASKRDRNGETLYDVSVIEDISDRKQAEERVQYLATHDGLTGLPNRTMFGQLLTLSIDTARRYNRRFAVLFIDLDRFKVINDSLGHDAGDVLLREVAARLRECLRSSDIVARMGGDEFVVLLPEITDASQAASAARHILSAVMKPVVILGQECRVTASIGICMHPDEGQDDQTVLKNADMAMYLAKEEGKNNFQFFNSRMQMPSIENLELETQLRGALERNELSLHYQAKLNISSGAITGVEALLRWRNPRLGNVPPVRFIPLAEETGLIVQIGRWVLRTACEQSMAWLKQGLPAVGMSVNLSKRQLNDEGLLADVRAVLEQTGMDPKLLELEVTESTIMHNADRAVAALTAIKQLGVRLAIDDFGTGYSSLSHLKRFPVDTLKVDRSFIREAPSDPEDRAIAEAIIAMGKTLSLTVVAEGVETAEQQTFLSERFCDEMQGYYFSTPVAAQDFEELLRQHVPSPRR
jgi:diguanylate cyclase (GGDEF)-like protein/PAS domain S-box-containing protein